MFHIGTFHEGFQPAVAHPIARPQISPCGTPLDGRAPRRDRPHVTQITVAWPSDRPAAASY